MRRRDLFLIALAFIAVAGWLVFRVPDGGGEKKGILKERLRAAESATQTLDAERAAARDRLRLAGKKADENRARFAHAAAALPFYERRRKEASARWADSALAERGKKQESFENVSGCRIKSGMTQQRRADGTERTANDAALLRRLNALLQ